MNNITLKKVGRSHTSDMVKKCFFMAREIGFNNINMDLIAGLPDETVDMFCYSIDELVKLNPENITVHSMAVKRAASLRFTDTELAKANDMNDMLSYAQKIMELTGRKPYYMYRQKNISSFFFKISSKRFIYSKGSLKLNILSILSPITIFVEPPPPSAIIVCFSSIIFIL